MAPNERSDAGQRLQPAFRIGCGLHFQQFQPAGPLEGACRSNRPGFPGTTKTKHKTNIIMKKKLIIAAAAIVASVSVTYAANTIRDLEDHLRRELFKCTQCNGTGWKGQSKCQWCGGDGETGN